MKSALRLRELLSHISDKSLRNTITDCLDEFERNVLPALPSLRAQVIHNDFNPENVLVEREDSNKPAGVIDFGDMLKSPLIFDLGVAASYLRVYEGNPLSRVAEFVAGYHSVTPLEQAEIDILPILIRVRLCTTITILKWRESLRGADDAYLRNAVSAESSAEVFLGRLLELPRENTRNTLRQVCASVDATR
jgi:Ser/Thr protein kinase RdoA (MazF antagonist)